MKNLILTILILSCNKITQNLCIKDKDINEALVVAINNNDAKRAIYLIKKGSNLNYIYKSMTVFELILNNNLNIVKILVESVTNVDEKSNYGLAALSEASE